MVSTGFRMLVLCLVYLLAPAVPAAAGTGWTLRLNETNALPLLEKGGRTALMSNFAFWASNWKWTDLSTKFAIRSPQSYSVTGKNEGLGFTLDGQVTRTGPAEMRWQFVLDAAKSVDGVMGGGMVFKFDLEAFGAELGEPELLPGNQGWTWGKSAASRLEMRFDPPLAAVYYEVGRKNEIRAFFYKGAVPQGVLRHTATLVGGQAVAMGPTQSERHGLTDPAAWPKDQLEWRHSPVDLSFLNAPDRPAGSRGIVKAAGERLVFEDGTPARFWGTNLTAGALFKTSREATREQAMRLSALGFNLVRLHHHDSDWVKPNVFGDKTQTNTQRLDPAALDAIDWWIKCLKDEGIYVWLDLHVGRTLTANDDAFGFEEMSKGKDRAGIKGFNYINVSVQHAMRRFQEAYLSHRNPYTGLRYVDDPAIAAVLITNENDLTHHFGNALLPDKGVPKHHRLYMAEAEGFARQFDLPKDKTWRSWEHGPSKVFLNDLEQRFTREMIAHLRGLGFRGLIATTNTWGNNPLSSLPALTAGDVIDVHSYGGAGQLEKNPVVGPGLADWLTAGQVAGKPMTVTEWNAEPFPTADRHALPLYVAGTASLQGWDALMQYAYSQVPLQDAGGPSNWHAFNDPALIATLPAAALLYRRGDARESETAYVLDLDWKDFFYRPLSPTNAAAIRTATDKAKFVVAMPATPALPWLERAPLPKKARLLRDPNASLVPADAIGTTSDTGELRRDWSKGIYTIDTPRTQLATGWIGGESIRLKDVAVATETRNASVAVQSLDDRPIAESRKILVSLAARSVPPANGRLPFHSEPVEGHLSIQAPSELRLFNVGPRGDETPVPHVYRNGRHEIRLDGKAATHWLMLKRIDG
jgi:hypothetical protein